MGGWVCVSTPCKAWRKITGVCPLQSSISVCVYIPCRSMDTISEFSSLLVIQQYVWETRWQYDLGEFSITVIQLCMYTARNDQEAGSLGNILHPDHVPACVRDQGTQLLG